MHKNTKKSSKSNKVTSSTASATNASANNASINNANAATLQAASANAAQTLEEQAVINAAHIAALATNNVFNALQAANPLQNSVLTLQQAQQLTNVANNVQAQQASKKTNKASTTKKQIAYIVFMHNLIAANAYTAKQISAMCAAQFSNVKLSTINTTLTDAKNAKYTRFGQVAQCNASTKILSFASANNASANNAQ
jgi:hypothetical protein